MADDINVIDVKSYGAKGDGVTDDSDAFIKAIAAIEKAAAVNPAQAALAGDNNRRGRMKLEIPIGCYVITKPEVFMRSTYRTRTVGFAVSGAGRGLTQIYYKNTRPNMYLLYNNDAWLSIVFSDIEFTSSNGNNNFMLSVSSGGAQNYVFERCSWNGYWNYIFHLNGSDNNSEMTWFHCNFNGVINKGVYVPSVNASDQFLNYNFFACNFEVSEGDFLHFEKGGNINIWGGSLIHYGENAGTFFRLYVNPHSYGVQRFLCVGARFEHRNATSKLINCEWNDGAVSFINCDMSSASYMVSPKNVNSLFTSGNQKMPSIKFDNCMLMGRHEFRYNVNSWNSPHNVIYENCEFSQAQGASDFIQYTNLSGNAGGQPQIKFSNCRSQGADATSVFFDTDYGFNKNNRAQLTKKLVSIKNADGNFPRAGGSETFYLPLGAIVMNIKLLSPAGSVSSSSAADYKVQTSEAVPTILASVSGTPAKNGFNVNQDLYFVCDTASKRQLKLVAGARVDQFNSNAYCLVEYIG
ncbi:glycosyl hydrolase family 28-related protein [Paenibacillus eucommiae]|uniref:Rhamnogalacturonase A/B/Epimerase-like pectate lyase domain-containing protein n=1 Tax=Paenibacillus eucommiae TaxID=1355755 RepID=A0ABS4J2A4_9BACL|nr:glycosyl hydrolase family 28-related protein [Paenibacillus eucommiae]MBP1993965.1 hypothetical protein [Paenibacillus eucommiae]